VHKCAIFVHFLFYIFLLIFQVYTFLVDVVCAQMCSSLSSLSIGFCLLLKSGLASRIGKLSEILSDNSEKNIWSH